MNRAPKGGGRRRPNGPPPARSRGRPCPAAPVAAADRGSGTVWTLAVTAVVGLMATVALAAGGVRAARHRAHTAADLAALAAASHATAPEAACRAAAEVATGSGGSLSTCVVRGRIADVTVVVTVHVPEPVGVLRLHARARAGPADPAPYAVPPG
jgi:secretion/DNA translocation related TadE-like protein